MLTLKICLIMFAMKRRLTLVGEVLRAHRALEGRSAWSEKESDWRAVWSVGFACVEN